MISRRSLLTRGTALVALTGLYGTTRFATTDSAEAIAALIRHQSRDRAIAPGTPEAFAADYAPLSEWRWQQTALQAAHAYHPPWARAALPASKRLRLEQLDRTIWSEFLLATDYDPQTDSPQTPLEYIGLTTDRLCNPFARLRTD